MRRSEERKGSIQQNFHHHRSVTKTGTGTGTSCMAMNEMKHIEIKQTDKQKSKQAIYIFFASRINSII